MKYMLRVVYITKIMSKTKINDLNKMRNGINITLTIRMMFI